MNKRTENITLYVYVLRIKLNCANKIKDYDNSEANLHEASANVVRRIYA